MSNCAVMSALGLQKMKNAFTPLAPHSEKHNNVDVVVAASSSSSSSSSSSMSADNRAQQPGTEGKENTDAKHAGGSSFLSKVCRKLRSRQKRQEKCEKCGLRSDTCLPNPSFVSGRKHFLCQNCRVSSDNMKNMYHQLCRNLSLRETRTTAHSDRVTPPSSWSRATRSGKTRPPAPESGYETSTSLESSCSNGRLSPAGGDDDVSPASTSSGECGGRCVSPPGRYTRDHHPAADETLRSSSTLRGPPSYPAGVPQRPPPPYPGKPCAPCVAAAAVDSTKDRSEVFGAGAFVSEKSHLLRPIQTRQKVYTRPQTKQQQQHQQQQQQHPVPPPAASSNRHHQQRKQQQQQQPKDATEYDGYLKIQTTDSKGVKYVFRQRDPAELAALNDEDQEDHLSRRRHTENLKLCYRCKNYRCDAFRAPFQSGWLCEDCMDDLL